MSAEFTLGRHRVGGDNPTYFVADIAANHDGDLERAKELIYLCAEAGGNAAKFQNFTAKTLVSNTGFIALGEQKTHQANWGKSVFDVYDAAALPLMWTQTLKETCDDAGIDYFTSLYDIDLLAELSPFVCAWKVGSGDITWYDQIERLARDGKPILIATGAAEFEEVKAAMAAAERHSSEIVLMQCNTNYTGSIDNFKYIALNVLKHYGRAFPNAVLGLSDHTPGHTTVIGAVTLGARVIEKHFTDDTTREGSDHPFSLDPASWREMIDRTREIEVALGSEEKHVMENERDTIVVQRRSVRAAHEIQSGTLLSTEDLTALRPCPVGALPPYRIKDLIGRKTVHAIKAGDCVGIDDVE